MLQVLEGSRSVQILTRLLIAWKTTRVSDLLRRLRSGEVWVSWWLPRRCAYSVFAGTRSLRGYDGIHLVWILLWGLGALLLLAEGGILIGEAVRVEHALGVEDVWVGGRVREAISGESVVGRPSVHVSWI